MNHIFSKPFKFHADMKPLNKNKNYKKTSLLSFYQNKAHIQNIFTLKYPLFFLNLINLLNYKEKTLKYIGTSCLQVSKLLWSKQLNYIFI